MLSEHFSREEMACKCCHGLPEGSISQALLDGLEKLRKAVGDKPIHVTNAYRCVRHNKEVGGVPNSQHVQGCAADIWVDGYTAFALGQLCSEIFDGVGTYIEADFVHVDMRDNGQSTGQYVWFE